MYCLVDVNSMYCSCEQLFRPDLKDRAVAVLSNNDGIAIAVNRPAKQIGVKRGTPYFQLKPFVERDQLTVFSSNYALYGELSMRTMQILESMAPRLEQYSIDEAFLFIPGINAIEPHETFGQRVRDTVLRQVGLTCGVGIAQTRTLAKLANSAAKKWPATGGVVALTDPQHQHKLMALVPVSEVWGVGRQLTHKLQMMGIKTALQLADANLKMIRQAFGVVLERTVRELNGTPCIEIDSALPAKQQIISSRSFGDRITELQPMREAVCQYAERAAEKLRQERQYCRHISVFLRTSPYSTDPYYSNSGNQTLMLATQDTREIVAAAMRALDAIWRPGFRYQKAGVMLNALTDRPGQIDLFDDTPPRANADALMRIVDSINQTGLGKIWFAGQGINQGWAMKRGLLSPSYTTSWNDIPKAKLI